MANLEMRIISASDGSWEEFKHDWQDQCSQVGDTFDEYASDSLSVLADIVSGALLSVGGDNETHIGALWDNDASRYYAVCMLNLARLPHTTGKTLRIRHLVVSPLLDYGIADIQIYPDVLIGILAGVVHLSSTNLEANQIRFHLRSPEDQAFFRAFGSNLAGSGVFAEVETHGAWLYITKADSASAEESQ